MTTIPHEGAWKWWWDDEADSIYSFLADAFYCGALIDRHLGAYVDHRYLPYPDPRSLINFAERGNAVIGWTVTRWEVEFFRLLHVLGEHHADTYEEGIRRANFVIDES